MNAPLKTKNDPPDASLPSGRFCVDGGEEEKSGEMPARPHNYYPEG